MLFFLKIYSLLVVFFSLAFFPSTANAADKHDYFSQLFGYGSVSYATLDDLPEWTRVLHLHPKKDFDRTAELKRWNTFLESTQRKSLEKQVKMVNLFTNKQDYVLDIDNYGVDDYWAIIREFLKNNGDCEDYAITKFFSLRQLGFPEDSLRIVVLQDTNLGIAHAVVAVALDGDILILDNQVDAVLSHRDILHYTPLFSVNENRWWLHLPKTFTTDRG